MRKDSFASEKNKSKNNFKSTGPGAQSSGLAPSPAHCRCLDVSCLHAHPLRFSLHSAPEASWKPSMALGHFFASNPSVLPKSPRPSEAYSLLQPCRLLTCIARGRVPRTRDPPPASEPCPSRTWENKSRLGSFVWV